MMFYGKSTIFQMVKNVISLIFVIFELKNEHANPEWNIAEVQFQGAIASG